MMSTGIISDNQTMFNEALDYFHNGAGNGAIDKTIWVIYNDGTGQLQEVMTLQAFVLKTCRF